jgi:hypothetical protein
MNREAIPDFAAISKPDRSGFEFAQVAVTLAMAYPDAKTIHLVIDNLNIHQRKALADVFLPRWEGEMATCFWAPRHRKHWPYRGVHVRCPAVLPVPASPLFLAGVEHLCCSRPLFFIQRPLDEAAVADGLRSQWNHAGNARRCDAFSQLQKG